MNSMDNLLGVCAFLDRHSLVQMQQTNRYLNDFVLEHFSEAPYHLLQLLEYRDANRAWILNGEETFFYHLRKILMPEDHIVYVAEEPEFSNALHITHCRPSDHIDIIAVASTLCTVDDNEDQGNKSFKRRLRINSADWKSDYVDLVDVLKERFLHAIDPCVAFELVFQIYPKKLCSDFESGQLRLENPKTNEILKVKYWKEGYENVASELRYFCRVRRIRITNAEERCLKRKLEE
ncbi:hypothetical protein Ddc_18995 [Ditylenchus destructor]|nr:hypothetical protein Ddc_18995 [Ditylenchus destructor]